MRIIISPAKKMNSDTDSLECRSLPDFIDNTEELCALLKSKTYDELKKLWKCNDQLAALNTERLEIMDLHSRLTPAILAYEGIQYQHMAPNVFTYTELDYIQEHLRILSGFYGLLRPFDGVTPYRLEMQAKLKVGPHKDLYSYWGSRLAEKLFAESKSILNLASKEYSRCIEKYLPEDISFVTVSFGELKEGKIIEKGTMCKMARGEMVRFMAENNITDFEGIKTFDRMNYHFSPEHSKEKNYVFILQK